MMCFPTLDAGLPLWEGVRGAAAQLTYMADMGVISIESKKTNDKSLCCESFSNLWKLESFR